MKKLNILSAQKFAGGIKKRTKRSKKIKVLFVCSGNTCRSPMAEHLFKSFLRKKRKLSGFEVSSAGVFALEGQEMSKNAQKALLDFGISAPLHRSKQFNERMASNFDLIVCMTKGHKELIEASGTVLAVGEITGSRDVPDPFGGSLEQYLSVAQYLNYACQDIYNKAINLKNQKE